MPCTKGMTECRRNCLHRHTVNEYRVAREAAEQAREAETRGYRTETAEYGPILTFREWLETLRETA